MSTNPTRSDFVAFQDEHMHILLPPNLRQKKGIRYFRAPKKDEGDGIWSIAVDLQPIELLEASTDVLLVQTPREILWQGVLQRVIRRGPIQWIRGGVELLAFSERIAVGDRMMSYHFIIPKKKNVVKLMIEGRGEQHCFEKACKMVALSIKIV